MIFKDCDVGIVWSLVAVQGRYARSGPTNY